MAPREAVRERLWFIADWVAIVLLYVVSTAATSSHTVGFRQTFDPSDLSIGHAFAVRERVPGWALYVIALVVPVVLVVVGEVGVGGGRVMGKRLRDGHRVVVGLVLSLALTVWCTNFLKDTVGRPRPDLLSRCILPDDLVGVHTLVSSDVCTTTNASRLADGFRSFPSGHSSASFAGLVYLSLWIGGKLSLFVGIGRAMWGRRSHGGYASVGDDRADGGDEVSRASIAVKLSIVTMPVLAAALVAVSRVMDYRHRGSDVIGGALLGSAFAIVVWQFYGPVEATAAYASLPTTSGTATIAATGLSTRPLTQHARPSSFQSANDVPLQPVMQKHAHVDVV
ncbi:hypothetical protein PYCC9005_002819 [Savitreella phatthalungensis]